ncbi:phage tail protein [uncultured Acinetobacter sp.]|uniref:phage tail-collar fiber domain-containing protein n=1 Tax=uncultured Acinetobacter sp. TaxID=165433 RepID=UPI00374A3949
MSEYYNITTNAGDAAIATVIANNSKLNITHVAFGDGNGSVPTPNKTRSTLVHEVHRQAVTKYTKHPSIANYIVIETIIPSNVGGFWIREMGIIADNVLISHAPFFKVADPDGVSEYRLKFTQDVRDGSVVEIVLDESLIYASQEWVNNNYIRRNELVDNLTSNDATKPLTAKQGKKLQDEKFDKSGGSVNGSVQLTADNTVLTVGNNFDIGFVKKEGASGKLIVGKDNNFSVVRSSNSAISINASDEFTEILSVDQNNNMSVKNALDVSSTIHAGGVVNYTPTAQGAHISWNRNGGQGRTDFINHKGGGAGGFDFYNGNENGYTLIATIDALGNYSSNAASATKLKNSRKIFGQDFDGSNDVSGNITTSTGILAADSYHYIDMGRETVDRMNFAIYNAVFNFIDSKTGDIVARITKNGIDCNANSASKLQTSRKIGGVDFDGTRDIVPKSIENTGRFPAPAQKDIPFHTGLFSVSQIYDNGYPVQYGNVLNIGGAGVSQIAVGWTGGIFHRGASDISNQWSNWREIAYIDSNVASATKLKNSRNLWGNNFDGTADTNGTLNFGDAGARKILIKAETVTDGGYIAVGNQGQDRGYIEIGTTDDENTEIWAAQRRGENGEFVRLARLLDESGNTSFPGNTSAYSFQLTTAPGDINKIAPGNGDGASYDNHNLVIRSWWGIGFRDYQDKCRIFIDTRTGNLKTKGTVEAGYITTEGNVNAGNAVTAKNVVASSDVKAEGWMYATKYVGKDGGDSEFVGNASSTTKLKTARKICGFDFDGSGDINIFPNNRLLPIGDDVFMGDGDVSGCLVIQSNSGTLPGIQFRNSDGSVNSLIQGGNISGNAATASKLQNSRNISISGAVSGNAWFDGSGDININTTLNQGLGVGQSWQDVTSNRAENTTYTNTTSKPIQIIVTSNDWNSSGALEFIVDNVSIANTSNSSAYSQSKSTSVIVPSGSSYRVNGNFKKWSELR